MVLEPCVWNHRQKNTAALRIVVNRKVDEVTKRFIFTRTIVLENSDLEQDNRIAVVL
jgi:hypothetical protein